MISISIYLSTYGSYNNYKSKFIINLSNFILNNILYLINFKVNIMMLMLYVFLLLFFDDFMKACSLSWLHILSSA